MSDQEALIRIKSFLAALSLGCRPSDEEVSVWERFFEVHLFLITSIVKRSDLSPYDLDDLVQEIWAILVRRLPKLELDPAVGTLHAWVSAVARHQAGRFSRRRRRRRHEALTPELLSELLDRTGGSEASMESEQECAIAEAAIAELVAGMPEFKRQILVAYWVNKECTSAIAASLEVSVELVWTTIRRARPAIARSLRRAGLDVELKKI